MCPLLPISTSWYPLAPPSNVLSVSGQHVKAHDSYVLTYEERLEGTWKGALEGILSRFVHFKGFVY